MILAAALSTWLDTGMLRLRSPCSLEAKSFGLGLELGLGFGLIEIGLVASNIYSAHDIN